MRKVIAVIMLAMLMVMMLCGVCYAEEVAVDGAGGVTEELTDEKLSLRDVLDDWLKKGDQTFGGQEWWAVVSTWVRANLDDILACIGGLTAFVGALLMILKTNPKLRAYVNSLGSSCKAWFEEIREGVKNLLEALGKDEKKQEQVGQSVDKLQQTVVLLVDTLEDVIKLSGADESKKDIYIQKIEQAKKNIAEGGDKDEV